MDRLSSFGLGSLPHPSTQVAPEQPLCDREVSGEFGTKWLGELSRWWFEGAGRGLKRPVDLSTLTDRRAGPMKVVAKTGVWTCALRNPYQTGMNLRCFKSTFTYPQHVTASSFVQSCQTIHKMSQTCTSNRHTLAREARTDAIFGGWLVSSLQELTRLWSTWQ